MDKIVKSKVISITKFEEARVDFIIDYVIKICKQIDIVPYVLFILCVISLILSLQNESDCSCCLCNDNIYCNIY